MNFVRTAWRAADRFIAAPPSSFRVKPLGNILSGLKASAVAARAPSLTSSITTKLPAYAPRAPPLHSNFSLPTRVLLGRPLSARSLPRAPTVPRSVTQVGLGTARNFSSTRHVFQNIVDNVPITTRALWEAEWDLKKRKGEKVRMRKKENKVQAKATIPDKLKENNQPLAVSSLPTPTVIEESAKDTPQFSDYFAPSHPVVVEGATAYLTIPLYPTVERPPLPVATDSSTLLPLSHLRDIHSSHSLHATRVSTIFSRLDSRDVWSNGVECECYGGQHIVSSLRVAFNGWTKAMVLEVIGEAGKGWCDIEEHRVQEPEMPASASLTNLVEDPTTSFILPTLDFSADFLSHSNGPSSPSNTSGTWSPFTTSPSSPILGDSELEGWSSGDELHYSSDEFEEPSYARPVDRSLGFSVDFMSRDRGVFTDQFF